MSIRKRPQVIDNRFDARDKGTFNNKPVFKSKPTEEPNRHFVPNLSTNQAIETISILLKDYQSKGLVVETNEQEVFRMWFPFARHIIQEGDDIKNISTGDLYRVEIIIKDSDRYPNNYVVLRGKTPPKFWHILRMDNRRSDLVSIIPAFPDTEAKPYEFSSKGHLQSSTSSTWTDTITYSVVAEEPGSLEGKMFAKGVQERKPKFREQIDNVQWFGQWIDSKIRFDFWTQTNANSERLREWFRDFTNKYAWLIEKNGVNRFLWAGSGTEEHVTRWRNDIVHRSAFYDFRTEYSFSSELFRIRRTELEVVTTGESDAEIIRIDNTF